jgi:hypothetical protein
VEPLLADGQRAEAVVCDMDGDGAEEDFYPFSAGLKVTLAGTAAGRMYLLLLRSAEDETVFWADQKTGGGETAFYVFFALPERRTDLLLELGSDAPGFDRITVALSYTPESAEPREETENDPAAEFTDLDDGAWYMDGIRWALDRGIMKGVDAGEFAPDTVMSRAMLVTVLYRMEDQPSAEAGADFPDVPEGEWYAQAVRWAAASGIVTGYEDGLFGPNDPLTREQLAVILYRDARARGLGFPGEEAFSLDFTDAGSVSDWAYEAMCWMTARDVIRGTDAGELVPRAYATRAQAAVMLMRYLAAVEAEINE